MSTMSFEHCQHYKLCVIMPYYRMALSLFFFLLTFLTIPSINPFPKMQKFNIIIPVRNRWEFIPVMNRNRIIVPTGIRFSSISHCHQHSFQYCTQQYHKQQVRNRWEFITVMNRNRIIVPTGIRLSFISHCHQHNTHCYVKECRFGINRRWYLKFEFGIKCHESIL